MYIYRYTPNPQTYISLDQKGLCNAKKEICQPVGMDCSREVFKFPRKVMLAKDKSQNSSFFDDRLLAHTRL